MCSKSFSDQYPVWTSRTDFNSQFIEPKQLYSCILKQSREFFLNDLRLSMSSINNKISSIYNINFSTLTPESQMSISGLMGVIASDFDGTTLRKDYSIQATEVIEEDVQE